MVEARSSVINYQVVHRYNEYAFGFKKSGVSAKRKGYCCELQMSPSFYGSTATNEPFIAQLLGRCNSSDVPKELESKIIELLRKEN